MSDHPLFQSLLNDLKTRHAESDYVCTSCHETYRASQVAFERFHGKCARCWHGLNEKHEDDYVDYERFCKEPEDFEPE